jgi:hypothetical protein
VRGKTWKAKRKYNGAGEEGQEKKSPAKNISGLNAKSSQGTHEMSLKLSSGSSHFSQAFDSN